MNNLYSIKFREIYAYIKTQDKLFWLICLYLFFEYVRPQTLYPALDILPYQKIILIFSLYLFFIRSNKYLARNIENVFLLLFFVVMVISSANAIAPSVSFEYLPEFVAWMIIYFLIANVIDTENRFLVFMLLFLLFSFKMSQFSFRNWGMKGFNFFVSGTGGGPGWFKNSGEFGIQMCIFLPLSGYFYYALRNHWSKWKKGFFFLFPFTALTGTISCSSRGALLGAAAVLIFVFLKTPQRMKGVIVIAVFASVVYLFLPEQQIERFRTAGEDSTSVSRLELWRRGIELSSRFPFVGIGYKNWLIAQHQYFGGAVEQGAPKDIYGNSKVELPHNVFIECASELGYSGLLMFLMMIVFTFVNNYKTRKLVINIEGDTQFVSNMAHGLDAALIGFLVSGFFVTVLYYPYFWINLAMTVALNNIAKKKYEAFQGQT